jgi:hypothetical protein
MPHSPWETSTEMARPVCVEYVLCAACVFVLRVCVCVCVCTYMRVSVVSTCMSRRCMAGESVCVDVVCGP